MEDENMLPLKRVEFSLTKFNEVAIPHHLDLLRQHKANIIKYEAQGEYARARGEQTHARRVAARLRALLGELDALRRRVRPRDRTRFDALTQRSRDTTLRAVVDYLGLIEDSCRALVQSAPPPRRSPRPGTSPLAINRGVTPEAAVAGSAASTDSVGVVAHHTEAAPHDDVTPLEFDSQIQLRVDDHEVSLQEREELLRGWSELQGELRALHDVWQHAQAAALAQREHVAAAGTAVQAAAEHTGAARRALAAGERLRAGAWGAWGAGGAALGLVAAGPVGLLAGAKAGALAAAAGSLLGYAAARLLGRAAADSADSAASADSADTADTTDKLD